MKREKKGSGNESQSHTGSGHAPLPLRDEGSLGPRKDTNRESLPMQSPTTACYLFLVQKYECALCLGAILTMTKTSGPHNASSSIITKVSLTTNEQ